MRAMERYSFTDEIIDVGRWDEYTGRKQWNAVYTVQIGELIDAGVFDWENPLLDWSEAAYDAEQYSRICVYFIERFYYREISIEPFREWARTLKRKLVYELMPKYKMLYDRVSEGLNIFADSNEYHKSRIMESAYPQTQLSGNSDYVTDGKDTEYETIHEGSTIDKMLDYAQRFEDVDQLLLDELESMFICLYTADFDATW